MENQPIWINKDDWNKGPAPMLVFEGRVKEDRVYAFMKDEGILPPEGMRLKRPSWYQVIIERNAQGKVISYRPRESGQWITVARFVPQGENKALDFFRMQEAAGVKTDGAAEQDNKELPF